MKDFRFEEFAWILGKVISVFLSFVGCLELGLVVLDVLELVYGVWKSLDEYLIRLLFFYHKWLELGISGSFVRKGRGRVCKRIEVAALHEFRRRKGVLCVVGLFFEFFSEID